MPLPTLADLGPLPVRDVRRRKLDLRAYRMRSAASSDVPELVSEPCILREGGLVKVVYLHLDGRADLAAVFAACQRITYDVNFRSSGMATTSRIFGFEPRKTLRKDFCGAVSLATDFPAEHDTICGAAQLCEHFYRLTNPTLYAKHVEMVANRVLATYHLANGVFTSGIVNNNNPLPYHFDSGNFSAVWSAMLVFKDGIAGGHLAVPQYELAFALPHNSLLMFDGQGLLHGVTPIERLRPDSRRFSIVFYSLRSMWSCLTPAEELARIRTVKTARERRRAGLPPNAF